MSSGWCLSSGSIAADSEFVQGTSVTNNIFMNMPRDAWQLPIAVGAAPQASKMLNDAGSWQHIVSDAEAQQALASRLHLAGVTVSHGPADSSTPLPLSPS